MPIGHVSEAPIVGVEKIDRQPNILPKERRDEIAESLKNRNLSFNFYNVNGGRDTTRLEPFRDRIESTGYSAIREVADEIPIQRIDFAIYDLPEKVNPLVGIQGYTWWLADKSFQVELDLDPESPIIEKGIDNLQKLIRHESYHAIRIASIGQDKKLFARMISEGLAVYYENEREGSDPYLSPQFQYTRINPEELPALLEKVKEDWARPDWDETDDLKWDEANNNWDEWVVGSEEKGVPPFAGYHLGYYLVKAYLKAHPNEQSSTLYATPAEEFISVLTDIAETVGN